MKKTFLFLIVLASLGLPVLTHAAYSQATVDSIVDKIRSMQSQKNRSDKVLHDIMDKVVISKANDERYRPILQKVVAKMKQQENYSVAQDEWSTSMSRLDNVFIQPLELFAHYSNFSAEMPKVGNVSLIFFDENHNTASMTTTEIPQSIYGSIKNDVSYVEVTRDGDMERYFLQNYKPGDKKFVYNISKELGNIRPGMNRYLIRGYGKNSITYAREYLINYITPAKPVIMKQTDMLQCEEGMSVGGVYTKTKDDVTGNTLYHLGYASDLYGDEILVLADGTKLIYGIDRSKQIYGLGKFYVEFSDGSISNTVDVGLGCGMFSISRIEEYQDSYLILHTGGGHEGESSEFLIDLKRKKITSIDELVKNDLGVDAYYIFDVKLNIEANQLIVSENNYCCSLIYSSRGLENIIYDLNSLERISRNSQESLVIGEWGTTFIEKNISFTYEKGKDTYILKNAKHGFNAILANQSGGQKEYKIINSPLSEKTIQIAQGIKTQRKVKVYGDKYIELVE